MEESMLTMLKFFYMLLKNDIKISQAIVSSFWYSNYYVHVASAGMTQNHSKRLWYLYLINPWCLHSKNTLMAHKPFVAQQDVKAFPCLDYSSNLGSNGFTISEWMTDLKMSPESSQRTYIFSGCSRWFFISE